MHIMHGVHVIIIHILSYYPSLLEGGCTSKRWLGWKRIPEDSCFHGDVGQDTHIIFSGLSASSGTVTLLSRLLARGYSFIALQLLCCDSKSLIFWSCLIHHVMFISIFYSRELSAVFHFILTVLGRPCTGHTFSAGVTFHSFILHLSISSVTVLGTTLIWSCVQQCSRHHISFIFTSFSPSQACNATVVRCIVFSNQQHSSRPQVKCRYSGSDELELEYQPSQLQYSRSKPHETIQDCSLQVAQCHLHQD